MAKDKGYFSSILETSKSVSTGLAITLKHLWKARKNRKQQFVQASDYFSASQDGIVTLQYPKFKLPVPAIGRYQLDCVIEDCIVCDKCAKVCPVNCIDIVGIKAPESIGEASDGTTKRIHAAKFDIDMAKCCFCGLCTTVCPTECLTMTNIYDVTTFSVAEMNYPFAKMSLTEIAQAQQIADAQKAAKVQKAEPVLSKEAQIAEMADVPATEKAKFSPFKKKKEEPKTEAAPSFEIESKADLSTLPIEEPKPKATFKPFGKKPAANTNPETPSE